MRLVAAILVSIAVLAGCMADESPSDDVRVPDVVGLTNREAQERLENLSFRWAYTEDGPVFSRFPSNSFSTGDDSEVVDQEPAADTMVEPGTVIRLETACPQAEPDCLD